MTDLLWPSYAAPADLKDIESIPLEHRGLPESTYALLTRAATLWPEQTAVTVLPDATRWDKPAHRTFSELLSDVHKTANFLRGIGVGRNNAVALISPNCDALLTATLAAQLAGIAAPINGGLSSEHVAELLTRSGARVLIAAAPELDAASWEMAEQLATAGVVDTVLALPATGGIRQSAMYDGSAFRGKLPAPGDLAAIFHTGGTTGAPKLAAHTHANEVTDAWMIAANSVLDENATIFAALPLFHVNALVVTLLAPMMRGQRVIWAGPLGYRDPALYANFWKIVQRYAITSMSAVPTVYGVLAQCAVDADISSLRFALVGASALPVSVRRDFEAHTGIRLLEGYGLTEATCASARSFPDDQRPGSVGQRLPYQQVKTVRIDADGLWHDLPTGEVGHLVISSPTVFPGYVTAGGSDGFVVDGQGKLVDGWLDTGDLARIDSDGFIYLTGRAKDLIIRGGHNIDPATIEDALLQHPDVTGAAAVGRPDTHAGEVPVAYVTLRSDCAVTGDQLRAWASEHVADKAAAPKVVTIIDTLPVTAVGKPYKPPLRADAAHAAATDALADQNGIESIAAAVEDGSPVVTVTLNSLADHVAVEEALGRYPMTSRVEKTP
ncbi:acyl-CoA synthetase [Mycobacterium sp. ACS1612]|uniref:AMP-binding protein n=1 Tax=Mycobacterium sp. ACS1612 TaxID=1834117 RepID=UPI0007FF2801|nr:AMP-binding protein [Mycobacterium sp. ACS1612]OBF36786.1 acyl-CoA synthetase [Mycobacterium sp. ACS1612]